MKQLILFLSIFLLALSACKQGTKNNSGDSAALESETGNWYDDAVIYEVNIRQYTPEGTFNAFAKHLPRLHELGVEVLWIMPVQPISEKNRKGALGSYYSVADYVKVNPEFGTMEDFKALVTQCHELGMKVIIDWVANHTGWDNPWIEKHPEWYTHDSTGVIIPPVADWSDVADLNFDVPEMRHAMIDAMDFWLSETNIDGFRCDVAWGVPADFWEDARASFDSIKPVFMLAEDEDHLDFLNKAFHSNYAWEFHHIMNEVAKGEKPASDLVNYFERSKEKYPEGSFPMQFITNHDENSWQGTINERMGEGGDAFAIVSFTVPGMPLIYSGQEAGLNKRLEFFEKDLIDWDNEPAKADFYASLIDLKQKNKALWNGTAGGGIEFLKTSDPEKVVAYKREVDGNTVLVVLNLSGKKNNAEVEIGEKQEYVEFFSNEKMAPANKETFDLSPWGYLVFVKN